MSLVFGLFFLALTVLITAATLMGTHRPNPPKLLNAFMIDSVIAPAVVTLLTVGVGLLIEFVLTAGSKPFGLLETGLALAIVVGFAVGWKALKVRQHLTQDKHALIKGV